MGNDGKINNIITNNEKRNLPIINQIIVSEVHNSTIFDIGNFFTLNNKNISKRGRKPLEELFPLIPFKNFTPINSYEFFLENDIIKGKYSEKYKLKISIYSILFILVIRLMILLILKIFSLFL